METLKSYRGRIRNGQLATDPPLPTNLDVEVVVTFLGPLAGLSTTSAALESDAAGVEITYGSQVTPGKPATLRWEDYGFTHVRELLKDVPGNLSDDVIQERRESR